jgi:hypothetical protein
MYLDTTAVLKKTTAAIMYQPKAVVLTSIQDTLNLHEHLVNKSTNITTDGASDVKYPSVKAVKTYTDGRISDDLHPYFYYWLPAWSGVTTIAPSKNAIDDLFNNTVGLINAKLDTTKATYTMRGNWNSAYGWGNWNAGGLTTGYIPYKTSTSLGNSVIYNGAGYIGINTTTQHASGFDLTLTGSLYSGNQIMSPYIIPMTALSIPSTVEMRMDANAGISGYILTSSGSGTCPTWQPPTSLGGLATTNISVQSLSGTTPTWNATSGVNATLTLSGNTTITLSNLVAGTSGNIRVENAATHYTLTVSGYTNDISGNIYATTNQLITSGSSKHDRYSWYYDGTILMWNGALDTKR